MADLQANRIQSIDAFRGLLIILMFLVGSRNPWEQFRHAPWIGFHLADLVYPGFLLTIGVSLELSRSAFLQKGGTRSEFIKKMSYRVFKLFVLGNILLSLSYSRPRLGLGTLQCISIALLIALPFVFQERKWKQLFLFLLFTASVLLEVFVGNPRLENRVLWQEGFTLNEYVDLLVLGKVKGVEGVLSTIYLSTLVVLGTIWGEFFSEEENFFKRSLFSSTFLFFLALLLERAGIPFSAQASSASFIFLAASIATAALSFFVLLVDRMKLTRMAFPFTVYGMNAIGAYVFVKISQLAFFDFIHVHESETLRDWLRESLTNYLSPVAGDLSFPVIKVLVGFFFCLLLYRRKVFLKI